MLVLLGCAWLLACAGPGPAREQAMSAAVESAVPAPDTPLRRAMAGGTLAVPLPPGWVAVDAAPDTLVLLSSAAARERLLAGTLAGDDAVVQLGVRVPRRRDETALERVQALALAAGLDLQHPSPQVLDDGLRARIDGSGPTSRLRIEARRQSVRLLEAVVHLPADGVPRDPARIDALLDRASWAAPTE